MKRVRILLRVSSNQQLEADGDLSVQRQLVTEYVLKHADWLLDSKEYFEGSNSGYQHAVADRDILQEALSDAQKGEYDILVAYKDDRIGRRMWEIGAYVMTLKSFGIDIFTVKDGCISPETDDIMGQMMLALRYGNAQKSSADTGMRVRDTAEKLIQKGKFMGGCAPYGYRLELSGEISKHGRALHHLVVEPEQARVVRHIYRLSHVYEYGSGKIARLLNENLYYRRLAPTNTWKSGTVTGILTNPVYAGYLTYKRKIRTNGHFRRLEPEAWIKSEKPCLEIQIISPELWNKTQQKRNLRAEKYRPRLPVTASAAGTPSETCLSGADSLPLMDVIYCGYCGRKLTKAAKYSYWTLKTTGERRRCKKYFYCCQAPQPASSHPAPIPFCADTVWQIVSPPLAARVDRLLSGTSVDDCLAMLALEENEKQALRLRRLQQEADKISRDIEVLQSKIPDAMAGSTPFHPDDLAEALRLKREKLSLLRRRSEEAAIALPSTNMVTAPWAELHTEFSSWSSVFYHADNHTKKLIINRLVNRIEITREEISLQFNPIIDAVQQPQITDGFGVPEPGL